MSENQNSKKAENNDDINNIEPEAEKEPETFLKPKDKTEKKSDSIVKTAFILGILTFASALLLSVLNFLTAPVIADRLETEKADSVKNLFDSDIIMEELQGYEDLYINYSTKVLEVLYVRDNASKEPAGYCVTVSPKGFSGNIDMLVAVNLNCTVIDTAILSMSETAGVGTKIDEDSFKEQFKNKAYNISVNEVNNSNSIDTIANATISSRAFFDGVNAALAVVNDILNSESTVVEPVVVPPDETEENDEIEDITEEITEAEDISEEIADGENEEIEEESVTAEENEEGE